MKEYRNLINTLQAFEEDWLFDMGIEGCKASLLRQKENSQIDIDLLRKEYLECLLDHDLDWKELAMKSCLFSDIEIYSNWEIRSIVEYYLDDFIYPENTFTPEQKESIISIIKSVLKSENDWVGIKELLSKINHNYPSLKAYHLFNYKDYFAIELEVKKEGRDRLWVVDSFKLIDSNYPA